MSIAPDLLPGPSGPMADPNQQMNDPFNALMEGAPEGFGDPYEQQPMMPGDLYPEDEESYEKLLKWAFAAFDAAESARMEHAERWKRYFRLYRNYVERTPGDWHSTVFVPMTFWIIETIVPRLVAQLPKFTCQPVGPEDVQTAKTMETLLEWATEQSGLYVELVKAYKSALKYGTGILKTFHRTDMRRGRKIMPMDAPLMQTVSEPLLNELGEPEFDLDGAPIVETREVEVGRLPMGSQSQVYQYTAYDGPAAECIDIFNFWVAPEAHDEQSARYVIHRTYKEMSYIERRVKEGIYRWPSNMTPEDITDVTSDPNLERLNSIGLGASINIDPTRRPVELLEFWTDDGRVITMANRKAILRVQQNPFDHSEKPFVRIVDYLQEHEFWGVGEIEPIEGLQDVQNALVNSRIDNLRLILNSMFAVNMQHIEDRRDFRLRPGGVIRLKGDMKPSEVFERIDLGDVTGTAFTETEMIDRTVEKTSGVSGYQMGMDSPGSADTATGTAIIQEQGASRFGMKTKLIELMGHSRLGRHFGSDIQQFTTEERTIRLTGPQGQTTFQTFSPEALQGALDYNIESESSMQSQTMRTEQKMNLLGLMAQYAPQGMLAALSDVLDAMGIKDKERFMFGDPELIMQQQQMMLGMAPPEQEQGGVTPPPVPEGQDAFAQANPAEGTPGQANAERMLAELAAAYQQEAQV